MYIKPVVKAIRKGIIFLMIMLLLMLSLSSCSSGKEKVLTSHLWVNSNGDESWDFSANGTFQHTKSNRSFPETGVWRIEDDILITQFDSASFENEYTYNENLTDEDIATFVTRQGFVISTYE